MTLIKIFGRRFFLHLRHIARRSHGEHGIYLAWGRDFLSIGNLVSSFSAFLSRLDGSVSEISLCCLSSTHHNEWQVPWRSFAGGGALTEQALKGRALTLL